MRLKATLAADSASGRNADGPKARPPGPLCPQRVAIALLTSTPLRDAQLSHLRITCSSDTAGRGSGSAASAAAAAAAAGDALTAAPAPPKFGGGLARTSTAPAQVSAPAQAQGGAEPAAFSALARQLSRQMTLAPLEKREGSVETAAGDVFVWQRTTPLTLAEGGGVFSLAVPLSLSGSAEELGSSVRAELKQWDFADAGRFLDRTPVLTGTR